MKFELKDFSGGISDFIFGEDLTTSEIMENLEITKDRAMQGRWGSRPIDVNNSRPQTTSNIPSHIVDFQTYKIIFYGGMPLAFKDGVWTVIQGKNNLVNPLTEASNISLISTFEWNKHLFATDRSGSRPIKMFINELGVFEARTAGLPALSTTPLVGPSVDDGNNRSYIYYFLYSCEYKVGDVTHVDYGPVSQINIQNGGDFELVSGEVRGNTISSIPILSNTNKTHFDTQNIKIRIYRTVDGGSEGYFVGQVDNGTTSFWDITHDDDVIFGELVYISSGAVDNDPPPVSKFIDLSNGAGWYANTVTHPYRVMQSQLSDPDSVPDSYYLDFEEEIRGITSYQSVPIIFTVNQLWRVEGIIDIDGQGDQRKVMIADSVGCLSHSSIVKTDKGIFFLGIDSFYWTDGYTTKKIPGEDKNFPIRYSLLASNPDYIKGSFDRITNRIYWTTKGLFKYEVFVYDITFNSFTTWSGRGDSFRPLAILCSKDRGIYRADESGHVFVHEPTLYADPIVKLGTPPSTWQSYPVVSHYKHIAYSFGASDMNKWVTRLTVAGEGRTNLTLGIMSYDDTAETPKTLVPIEHKSGLLWNDPEWVWESPTDIWAVETRMNQTRYFKSGKLRCKRKQISIFNTIANITGSVESIPDSRVTIDSTLKTATILDPDLVFIPKDAIGMKMYINGRGYEVIDSNLASGSFILEDVTNLLVSGVHEWRLEGYPQNQRFHIGSIIYTYESLDDDGGYFKRGVTINES